jgi:hypothetical protein
MRANDFRARVVASNHIIADIFGKDSGSIYEKAYRQHH